MQNNINKSRNRQDYEILIRRRGEQEYASYCPQLNLMIKGTQHEEVAEKMEDLINQHIENLSNKD